MSVSKEPLNIRNNNPGNLRFVGQEGASQGEGGFAKFETPQAGLDAMRNQIELDTQKRGLNLTQFLNKYAPPSENKTTNYIDFVARKTGLDPSSPIPASAIPQLQAAMIEMEGGPRSMSYFTGTAAQATPAQAPRTTVQRTGLPASYRFALAANYLGDTEKDSVTEKAMQLMEEVYGEPGGGAGAFKKKLQSILAPREKEAGAFDVLAKAQTEEAPKGKAVPKMPKMFADGGLVAAAANLQRPILKPEEKEFLAAREKEFAGYISQAEKYNEALDNYQKQYAAYEQSMKGNPDYEAYTKAAEDYNTKVDNYNKLLDSYAVDPKGRRVTMSNYGYGNVYVTSYPGTGSQVNVAEAWDYNPINLPESSFVEGYPGQSRWVLPSGWEWVPTNPGQTGYQATGYLKKTGVSDPFESFTQRTAPTLEAKAPGSPPAEFTMAAPTAPTGLQYTWDQVQEYQNNAMTRAAKAARNRATALQVITGQGPYAGFGLSLFADGGEVGEQYESLEDVMAAAPTQDAEQRQWEQEIPVRELTRQLNETVDRYRAGRASEADLKQFFPNYSDYDIANMFGMTDAGQSGPRPEITAQPFLTPEVYDRAMNRGRMEEYNVEREIREKSPNIYPNKRDFTLQLQQLADGGEVNYDQMAEQMTVGTLPTDQRPAGEVFRGIGQDIVRGAQYLPYDLAGAPVDIATMAMRPFGYNVEKPVGGSEYLIEKARQAGIAQAPTGSTAETATRIGMGFVNPAAVARQIPRGIAALEKGAETIGTGAVRAITGKPEITTEQIYQAMADPQGIMKLGAPAATRPGGSFMYGDEVSQDLLELARTQKGPSEQAVIAFAPKIAKYMESQFSTPNDPLFAATLEGRFTPKTFYRPNSLFRGEAKQIEQITGIPLGEKDTLTIEHVNELLKRSKEGNEKAAKLVARGVDRSIYSTGQLTQDQIIDQLKNADVFNEAAKKIKDYVDMGIAKEFGSKENVAPIMAAFIRQKGVPTDDEQKAAFRTIEGRVTRKSEVEAERAIKSQAKNPLEAEYPIVVNPLQDYETSEFGRNLTPAMMEEMRRGKPIYKYSGPYGKPFDVNDVFEYMSENDPAKWSKMSAPELIIAASGKDPSTITNPTRIARMADDGLPLTPDQARVGTKSFMPVESPSLGKGSEWREITNKFGLRIEGGIMEHCLKRDSLGYCNRLMNQESRYFTLRDADGQPYVSIEVSKPIGMEDQDVPFNVIRQIKGHRNDPAVPLYGEEITDFLNRWQKEVGGKLSVSEKQEYVPSNFKPQQFGMTDPEGFAKGGMVDKPLYDRAV